MGLFHFESGDTNKIGWMNDWDSAQGFRRVAPSRYAQSLDSILLNAAQRNISVVFLTPCNLILASEEKMEGGHPWDVYFEIMSDVAQRRSVPVISGCQVIQDENIDSNQAFLDRMHPTSKLNQAYARAIVRLLEQKNWPKKNLFPQKLSLYSKKWDDPWPMVYPEPPAANGLLRPDNMDLNMKIPQKMRMKYPQKK